ncbi:MAG TPA: lysophospholipid acyltransferase family protein [Xanthomonadales bacterium]
MLARLSNWVLRKLGWTLDAELPPLDKYIIIAAPHTSNWDFPLGILAAKALRLNVYWMGKHSLFRWPYGWLFRALGGIPIRRDGGQNYIQQMADLFKRSERMILALAPEGTRSRTDHWKTGFHAIARAAKVPILMGYLDHGNKQVGLGGLFYPSDDIESDFSLIREFYADRRGKNPEKESLIQVRKKKT